MINLRPLRLRSKPHLKFVAEQPCMICFAIPCQAHHLLTVQPKGRGLKAGDQWAVPLCSDHHRALHDNGNERAWFSSAGNWAFAMKAMELAKASPCAKVRGTV
ncbi:hypothetical protein LCGC14_2074540 [marine sediment metagenome]|uniref:DUF968 domain-containing protein n=1 Tax=marine sediment metagenome TaxID=412755 RepID=A0A0F9HEF9_9ZZZZ